MKQHYVPKCYLKGFSADNGDFFSLDLEAVKKGWNVGPRRANVSGVCYNEDYYEVPKNNHPPTIVFDDDNKGYVESAVLGMNESRYPEIRNKFILGENLTIDDYTFLTDFIIQLKLRNPIWYNTINQRINGWLDTSFANSMEKVKVHPRFQRIPEPLRTQVAEAVLNNFKEDPAIATKMRLHSLIERTKNNNPNNQRVREAILNACWTMVDVSATAKFNFMTSDNPGFSFDQNGQVVNNMFQGDFSFMLPLTSRHCLKISSRGNPQQKPALGYLTLNRKQITDHETLLMNIATAQVINKLILSERDFELSYHQRLMKVAAAMR